MTSKRLLLALLLLFGGSTIERSANAEAGLPLSSQMYELIQKNPLIAMGATAVSVTAIMYGYYKLMMYWYRDIPLLKMNILNCIEAELKPNTRFNQLTTQKKDMMLKTAEQLRISGLKEHIQRFYTAKQEEASKVVSHTVDTPEEESKAVKALVVGGCYLVYC
jgi:hypothetical protein